MSLVQSALETQRLAWSQIARDAGLLATRSLPYENPKRILIFGVGSSFYAAKFAATTLRYALHNEQTGRTSRVPVIACSSMSIGTSGSEFDPAPGDWVFGFTHRGRTPATIRALNRCEQLGAFTCAITGKGAGPVPHAKLILETVEIEKCEPHTVSLSGAVCAVTSLLLGSPCVDRWVELSKGKNPNLEEMKNRAGTGPTHILGEWEGEWLAREGALKLMEMARLQVQAFGTEEYFHGPRLAHQKNNRIWHIETEGDQRTQELTDRYGVQNKIQVARDHSLSWVEGLVEMQWLSLATALNLSIDPDGLS